MKQWTHKEFCKMLRRNRFTYSHQTGSHCIYVNGGRHISIPLRVNACVALRLIKENNLNIKLK